MARLLLLALVLYISLPGVSRAHDSRPLFVQIVQQEDQSYRVRQVTPDSVPRPNHPRIDLPADCVPRPMRTPGTVLYRCAEPLAGRDLVVTYPRYNPSLSTIVHVTWASGETHSIITPPDEGVIAVPSAETSGRIAGQYFRLGVEHILIGYDHLLFLACLLVIAGTVRRVILTVTGFTLAHSVTLGLAALDVVRLPVPPVEAVIALSIIFLATEIARPRRDTLTWRYPILVSSIFGLVHGFGFAAVLGEIGMPQTDVPLALLFFNLGVEAGQLAFIAALMPVIWLFGWLVKRYGTDRDAAPVAARAVAYGVGITASYWMIDRIWGWVA